MLTLDTLWYKKHPLRWVLWPLSCVYWVISCVRRWVLESFYQHKFQIPIIVVGNLTVGGVGKTPLVIALVRQFQARGLRVGIVSRGYGAQVNDYPYEVTPSDQASLVGDEPLLLARKTACPVVIAPNRVRAVRYLIDTHHPDVIISDDGLQHYAMGRAIEMVVMDGLRGFGNGLCLPAGPLREGVGRLREVDFVVVNGADPSPDITKAYRMDMMPGDITQLITGDTVSCDALPEPIAAFAGIGHPARFFTTLKALGLSFKAYSFPDHYRYRASELSVPEATVVMTEKDAVKCASFATEALYFLPIEAKVDDRFWEALWLHKQLQGYVLR